MSAQDVVYAPITINKRAERRRRLLLFSVLGTAFAAATAGMLILLPYAEVLLHRWIS